MSYGTSPFPIPFAVVTPYSPLESGMLPPMNDTLRWSELEREEDDFVNWEDVLKMKRLPYLSYFIGRSKGSTIEDRKSLDVSKLAGLSSMSVKNPYVHVFGGRRS